MAMARAQTHSGLRLIQGSKHDPRRVYAEEADIEFVAFCDEVGRHMDRIVRAELAQDIPSGYVIHEAQRIAHKAGRAKAELIRLRGGSPDAA